MKRVTPAMVIGLIVLANTAWPANPPGSLLMIPAQINYQGRLVDTANKPYVDAVHTIDLTLYTNAASGEKVWSERYAVQTKDGYFSVDLGSGGGQKLLATNREIWQVLWRTNGSPDTFYMALTVRTSPTGLPLPTPSEATPRQQFLSTPFAYRAHQSLYASKADPGTLFDAPDGILSPKLTNTYVYLQARDIIAAASWGPLAMASVGMMSLGSQSNIIGVAGTRVHINPSATTTNLLINQKPMFVMTSKTETTSGSTTIAIEHEISTTDYDVVVAGFSCGGSIGVRGAYMNPTYSYATVTFVSPPPSGTSVTVRFLGIRKGLIHQQ